MSLKYTVSVAAVLVALGAAPAFADMAAAQKWVDIGIPAFGAFERRADEGDGVVHQRRQAIRQAWRSTCCRKAFRLTPMNRQTLTKAFEEITGIKVNHQILGEGEVVQAVQTQMQTNRNLYDAYVNDFRFDRNAFASAKRGEPDRLDGGRRPGCHASDA